MIEIDSKIIDADVLYERIKTTAKMKQISQEFYGEKVEETFNEIDLDKVRKEMVEVYQNLQMMNATWVIGERPLKSTRPVIGGLIVFCKRVYRKLTRWLFQTYYQQQTEFNGAATRTISDMIRVQELLIQLYENEKKKEDNNGN